MRIRSIKPEFWRSSDISCLPIEDRLLFVGLWSYVDDNGVGVDKLAAIAADLFADDIERDPSETFARVSRGLANLSASGRIIRYTVDGADFLEVSNWGKHQRIDKPGKPRHPRHNAEGAVIREGVARVRESVAPGTEEQGNRGTEDQGTEEQSLRRAELAGLFETAWAEWPKKVEKKPALEKFINLSKKHDPRWLASEIGRFGAAYAQTTDRQFVPGLLVWLNRERWTDELPQAPVDTKPQRLSPLAQNLNSYQNTFGGGYEPAGGLPAPQLGIGT